MNREVAQALAVTALGLVAGDAERLGRFLAVTGLGPATLRTAAREPGFLLAVLDHVLGDDALVEAVARDAGVKPHDVALARDLLAGPRPVGP